MFVYYYYYYSSSPGHTNKKAVLLWGEPSHTRYGSDLLIQSPTVILLKTRRIFKNANTEVIASAMTSHTMHTYGHSSTLKKHFDKLKQQD